MGIVTSDENLVDAALSEISSLPLHQRHEMDPRRDVVNLVVKHHLGQVGLPRWSFAFMHSITSFFCQDDPVAALFEAQRAVFAEPACSELRDNVASLAIQDGRFSSALAILSREATLLENASGVSRSLGLRAAAECIGVGSGPKAVRLAQKAIMLHPADPRNWRILAFVRCFVTSG
jgi:superkiller protein 3